MYAIQDYIGEDAVSEALAGFVKQYAFQGPPYPISLDLIAALKHVTPPQYLYLYLYEDLWENITLYENRVVAATANRLPDGTYQVRLDLLSHKLRSDGGGQEHAIAEDDWLDVGVLDRTGAYLYLQKHRIERDRTTLTITVDRPPARAGIDPLNKLIDRAPDDNVIDVDVQDGRAEAP